MIFPKVSQTAPGSPSCGTVRDPHVRCVLCPAEGELTRCLCAEEPIQPVEEPMVDCSDGFKKELDTDQTKKELGTGEGSAADVAGDDPKIRELTLRVKWGCVGYGLTCACSLTRSSLSRHMHHSAQGGPGWGHEVDAGFRIREPPVGARGSPSLFFFCVDATENVRGYGDIFRRLHVSRVPE